jgi:hypothetical protein
MTRCRNLHNRGRRQVRWRRIHPARRDGTDGRAPARRAVHAPIHARVRRVSYRGGKRRRISEHRRPALRRDRHHNGGRRWRRGHCRACASSAAAQRPRSRREESEKTIRVVPNLFSSNCVRGRTLSAMQAKGQREISSLGWAVRRERWRAIFVIHCKFASYPLPRKPWFGRRPICRCAHPLRLSHSGTRFPGWSADSKSPLCCLPR